MAKLLDPVSLAAFESMREVLSSHGLAICSASDTQYPKLDADLDKVLREMARNTVQAVLAIQDEQAHEEQSRINDAQLAAGMETPY